MNFEEIKEIMELISSGKKEALTQVERKSVIAGVVALLKAYDIDVLSQREERDFKNRGITFRFLN